MPVSFKTKAQEMLNTASISDSDHGMVKTAVSINAAVAKRTIEELKIAFDIEDPNQNLFNKFDAYKKRTRGALLYSSSALQIYFDECKKNNKFQNGEEQTLQIILDTFKDLLLEFNSYIPNPQSIVTNFAKLLQGCNSWMDIIETNIDTMSPEEAKEIAKTIYTSLKVMKLTLQDFKNSTFASLVTIDEKTIADVEASVQKAFALTSKLEQKSLQKAADVKSDVDQMAEGLHDQYLKVIKVNRTSGLPKTLEKVNNIIKAKSLLLEELVTEKTIINLLQAEVEKCDNLLDEISTNYKRGLISNNELIKDLIREDIKTNTNTPWLVLLKEMQNLNASTFNYYASQLVYMTPEFMKTGVKTLVDYLMPLDMQIQAELIKLIKNYESAVQLEHNLAAARLNQIVNDLIPQNSKLQEKFINAKLEEILHLQEYTKSCKTYFNKWNEKVNQENSSFLTQSQRNKPKPKPMSFWSRILSFIFSRFQSNYQTTDKDEEHADKLINHGDKVIEELIAEENSEQKPKKRPLEQDHSRHLRSLHTKFKDEIKNPDSDQQNQPPSNSRAGR